MPVSRHVKAMVLSGRHLIVSLLDISREKYHFGNAKSPRFPNCHRMVRVAANRQSRGRGALFELPNIVYVTTRLQLLAPSVAIAMVGLV